MFAKFSSPNWCLLLVKISRSSDDEAMVPGRGAAGGGFPGTPPQLGLFGNWGPWRPWPGGHGGYPKDPPIAATCTWFLKRDQEGSGAHLKYGVFVRGVALFLGQPPTKCRFFFF